MERIEVNHEVTISSVYLKGQQLETFPKCMEYQGEVYTFMNSGWRYLVHKGKEVIRVFSVTDGTSDYRLKLEPTTSKWTLLDIKPTVTA